MRGIQMGVVMGRIRHGLTGLGLGLSLAGIGMLGPTAAEQLPLLAKIQPGQWQIKEAGGTGGGRSVCVADPARVLQFAHGDAACTRTVIESSATKLTIRYSCPGKGQGTSVLTFMTSGAFRLQTQGMSGGAPFDHDYDAKRTGDCVGAAPAATPNGTH